MQSSWASEEMKSADLNDKRLNARLTQVLSALGERPTASIPAACGGWSEMVAAYRFFDNEKVTYKNILAPHAERTLARMAAQPTVVLVQDTTELDFTRPQQQMAGAGPLDGSSRCGAFLHPLVAFTPDGTPLGTCAATIWTREERSEETRAETSSERSQRIKATPIEEKESFRWIEGLRQAREVAQRVSEVKCICISDSESDIYELFLEPRGERPVEWLIRACHDDRSLEKDAENPDFSAPRIREALQSCPALFTQEISVRGRRTKVSCDKRARRQPRQSRRAQVEVRAMTAKLVGPKRPEGRLPNTKVNMVQVREVDAPSDDVPVEWLLITTLPIETVEQVREIVQYYTVRFMIEVLFRVLKSGCRVEDRQFEHIDRMLPCAAVYLIVAWRTLMICRLGQSCPDMDCEAIFEPAEWKSVWMTIQRKKPPRKAPTLANMLSLIAQLGGYVNYPNRKDPPGPQTIWLGMQRMYDLTLAWNIFGPGAARSCPEDET